MKILHLTIKKQWFDKIASGEKKEEYREQKKYWQHRFVKEGYWMSQTCKEFDAVLFRNGYSKTSPTILVECLGIELSDVGNPEWGFTVKCFVIKLGKIL
jgi:hypothetical protein